MNDSNPIPNRQRRIKVALRPDSVGGHSGFVAQCLDFNLVAQGKTEQLAKESFERVFESHVRLCLHLGRDPFPPGVESCRDEMFRAGEAGYGEVGNRLLEFNRLTEAADLK